MFKKFGYKLLSFIKRFWNNKNVQTFLPPFLYSLGPTIGSIAFEWNPAQKFITKHFYNEFDKWIQVHTGLALVLVVFWVPILYIIGKCLDYFLRQKINFEWLIASLEALDLPVKSKKSRFGEYTITFLKNYSTSSNCDIFQEITKPKKQFERLIVGLYQIFKSICNSDVKIVIFEYKKVSRRTLLFYFIRWPEDHPLSKPEELLQENSCVISSIKRGDLIVIEDIEKELRKPKNRRNFVLTSSGRNQGSILCFPIKDTYLRQINTVLVISIYSENPYSFQNSKKEGYKEILQRFADRILIEYYLYLIRKHKYGE